MTVYIDGIIQGQGRVMATVTAVHDSTVDLLLEDCTRILGYGLSVYDENGDEISLDDIRANTNQSTDYGKLAYIALVENGIISADAAKEHADAFDDWAVGVKYNANCVRNYGGELYRCLKTHTSQENNTPDTAVTLWDTK